jgi:dihydroorotate dehydrogenase
MYDLLRPLLFQLDAETAHGLTLYASDVAQRSGLSRLVNTHPPTCR